MTKKLFVLGIIFALTGFANLACADILSEFHPGFYAVFNAGFGHLDAGNGLKDWANNVYASGGTARTIDEKNWALRGGFGYRFTPYFELEAGYTYYPSSHYSAHGLIPGREQFMDMQLNGSTVDVVGKVNFPLVSFAPELGDLAPYIKLGAAYVRNTLSGAYGGDSQGVLPSHSIHESHSGIRPLYGIGVSYQYSEKWMFDFSWTLIPGKNKINFLNSQDLDARLITDATNTIAASSFLSFGIVYRWPLDY